MWWSIPIVAALALNVIVSIVAAKSHYPTKRHLASQLVIVWLLPVFGVVGLLLFVRSQSPYDPTRGFDLLYTPGDGGQPQQGWVPTPSDFAGSGEGGSSD